MKQLHPRAVWLFFIGQFSSLFFLGLIIGVIVLVAGSEERGAGSIIIIRFLQWIFSSSIVWLGLPILIIAAYAAARLSWYFYRYELTDNAFKKEHGIIWKRYVTIPYDRIQNVDINRGVFARLLGLSDLWIQTAGASGIVTSEGRLPGLSREDAEKLRDELIVRARRTNRAVQ